MFKRFLKKAKAAAAVTLAVTLTAGSLAGCSGGDQAQTASLRRRPQFLERNLLP